MVRAQAQHTWKRLGTGGRRLFSWILTGLCALLVMSFLLSPFSCVRRNATGASITAALGRPIYSPTTSFDVSSRPFSQTGILMANLPPYPDGNIKRIGWLLSLIHI